MKYITATIDAGGKLVCNLDYYIDSEGKSQTFPLIQSSVNYYAFRLITNNLPDEWRDILQAQNNRWVIFQNTHLEDGKNTTAMPLTPVTDRGMLYLQAVIPSYILAKPGVLSITILFSLGETIKTLATVSQNESDFEPLRILPANDTIDKAILSGITVEDKTIYHQLIGTLLGGSDGQVLQKSSASGTMGYTWVDGSKLSQGIVFGGYVTSHNVKGTDGTSTVYVLADITPTARTTIFGEGSTETQLILLNQASASDRIDGIISRGWAQCTNMQFLARESVNSNDGLNVSLNDYLLSDGEKWNVVPAVDKTVIERIVADSYVPWNYGSNAGDTEKTVNMVNISGNAGSADKVNHSLTIGPLAFDGSEDKTVESIDGSWLTAKTVTADKLADNVSDVYIPWNYSGGSQEAVEINIAGNAGSANKVNNKLEINGQFFDGSEAVTISAQTLATLLDAYAGAYIDTPNLRDLSVASGKIGKGAVISDKLASGAVVTSALADKAVTYAKLDGDGMRSRLLRIGTGNRAPTSSDASSYDLWAQWFE